MLVHLFGSLEPCRSIGISISVSTLCISVILCWYICLVFVSMLVHLFGLLELCTSVGIYVYVNIEGMSVFIYFLDLSLCFLF